MNPLVEVAAAQAVEQGMRNFQRKSTWEKRLWTIGTLIAIGYGAKKTYDYFTRTKADTEGKEMQGNLKDLVIKTRELSINEGQAILMSQSLFEAMNRIGTDFNSLISNLSSLKTQADLLYVIRAFGIRYYGYTGESNSWFSKYMGAAKPLNLNGWLKEELSGSQLQQVRDIFLRLNVPL